MTRDEFVAQTRELAEARGSKRWDDSEIIRLGHTAHRREWSTILRANPEYRVAIRTVTADANGLITKAQLEGGTGDAREIPFRVLGVAREGVPYRYVSIFRSPIPETVLPSADMRIWYQLGQDGTIKVVPSQAAAHDVLVNHYPTLLADLQNGTSTVVLVDGYEVILAYETAAKMLAKGGTEVTEAKELLGFAEMMRGDLLADLKLHGAPENFEYLDSAADWGG